MILFSPENLFLIIVGIIWIVGAIIQDFRKLEVANWWNFSLIIIALAYRGFLSLHKSNYWYVLWGVIGLVVMYVIAEGFYYGRMFGGGDTKLLMSLGAVLPLSLEWMINLRIFLGFLILFFLTAGIYGGVYTFVLAIVNYKRFRNGYNKLFKNYKKEVWFTIILALIILILSLFLNLLLGIWFSILIFISPFLLLVAKAIEDSCLIKKVSKSKLTIGDWLAEPIKIGRKTIKPNWQGISEKELELIKKKYKKKVLVKYGIPFTPAFLFAFILVLGVMNYL